MSTRILRTCAAVAAVLLWQAASAQVRTTRPPEGRKASAPPEAPASFGAPYESGGRRDPFLSPLLVRSRTEIPDEEIDRGVSPPGIAGMTVSQVVLKGISSSESTRLAVFRGTDGRAYFLQQGDKFFDGYLKSINEDSVVLVRERQYKSGKTVTDEITKRLRTP